MSNLTIGTLASESGVGIQTVRFYERKGLIRRPAKRAVGYRQYSPDDVKRIQFIKRRQELGFTLQEIKEILELNTSQRATCSDIQKKSSAKLKEIVEKIRDLQQMKRTLDKLSKACGDSKKAAAECKILDCFASGWKC